MVHQTHANNPAPTSAEESTGALLRGIASDTRDLAEGHLSQITLEIKREVRQLGDGLNDRAMVLAVGIVSAVLLAQTLALAVAAQTTWPLWAGFAVVAAPLLVAFWSLRKTTQARDRARAQDGNLFSGATISAALTDAKLVASETAEALK